MRSQDSDLKWYPLCAEGPLLLNQSGAFCALVILGRSEHAFQHFGQSRLMYDLQGA